VVTPLQDEGLVQNIFTITGRYDLNRAEIVAPLTDWSKRSVSQAQLTARLQTELDKLPGVRVRIRAGNSLGVGGGDGSVQMGVTGDDYAQIADAAYGFAQAIERDLPGLRDVRVNYTIAQPQLTLRIDRQRATELGVSIEGLDIMLRALVDGTEIAELTIDDRNLPVMLDSNAYRATDPQDLLAYSVRAGGVEGERLVPLSQFVQLEETAIASELERLGQRRAVQLSAVAVDGMPLPTGMGLLFRGDAATLEQTGRDVAITFAIALLVVFLVLVAQFEGITSAAVVIITVPFGLAAAVFAMTWSGTSLNIYSQYFDGRVRRPVARRRAQRARSGPGSCGHALAPHHDDHGLDRAGRTTAGIGQRPRCRVARFHRLGNFWRTVIGVVVHAFSHAGGLPRSGTLCQTARQSRRVAGQGDEAGAATTAAGR
jgi:HAE1 family hydrophobic/amphiphilic exporter-1